MNGLARIQVMIPGFSSCATYSAVVRISGCPKTSHLIHDGEHVVSHSTGLRSSLVRHPIGKDSSMQMCGTYMKAWEQTVCIFMPKDSFGQ